MRILTTESKTNLETLKGKKNFIPEMVDRVFLICKDNENFSTRKEIHQTNEKLTSLIVKIKKQNSLLEQAESMKQELNSKIISLDETSFRIKVNVLELLGSEL